MSNTIEEYNPYQFQDTIQILPVTLDVGQTTISLVQVSPMVLGGIFFDENFTGTSVTFEGDNFGSNSKLAPGLQTNFQLSALPPNDGINFQNPAMGPIYNDAGTLFTMSVSATPSMVYCSNSNIFKYLTYINIISNATQTTNPSILYLKLLPIDLM